MTTTAAALRAAMALIEDESRWCQGAYARSEKGQAVDPTKRSAKKWCAVGALFKTRTSSYAQNHMVYTALLFHDQSVVEVNDNLGHAAVMACYREAIRRAGDGDER